MYITHCTSIVNLFLVLVVVHIDFCYDDLFRQVFFSSKITRFSQIIFCSPYNQWFSEEVRDSLMKEVFMSLHLLFLILKSLWQGILSQSTLLIITTSLSSLVLTRWWYLPAVVEDVPVRSRINRCLKYWPCTTKYQPLLSSSSPRNTQSSQLNLVCFCFDTMMIFASLGWTSRD